MDFNQQFAKGLGQKEEEVVVKMQSVESLFNSALNAGITEIPSDYAKYIVYLLCEAKKGNPLKKMGNSKAKCNWKVSGKDGEIYPIYHNIFSGKGENKGKANWEARKKANATMKQLILENGGLERQAIKGHVIWGFTKKADADKMCKLLEEKYPYFEN